MKLTSIFTALCAAFFSLSGAASAAPTVYPTGATIYEPASAWNGYTVLSLLRAPGVVVIDMNGREVKRWDGFDNSAGGPARILPGGRVIAATGAREGHQESVSLLEKDFAGAERWRLEGDTNIGAPGGPATKSLRQHHDWQRADFPSGYYSPAFSPGAATARTLVLTHESRKVDAISTRLLEDDRIIEYDEKGRVVWQWRAADHVDEFGFSPAARAAIMAGAGAGGGPQGAAGADRGYDWVHINSGDYLGPNRWHDAGDARFAPDNVIISSRQASFVAIIARDGRVVWRIGPDTRETPALTRMGPTIGQHHAHLIPKGLPGAGNLLIFDNGGSSGYGFDTPIARNGYGGLARANSRVLEIDPVKLELVWSYSASGFFSTNISSAQRLPNGNTLITEGAPGRVFEVTAKGAIVWEYLNPYFDGDRNAVYRAYRVPYGWMPQIPKPEESPIKPAELPGRRAQ